MDELRQRYRIALDALSFFMADMQAGIGPFLGVLLLAHGWKSGSIGTVMTLGGIAGMAMTAPAGALIDSSRHKRSYVVVPGICTVAASGIVLASPGFAPVALSQIATAVAGSAIVPAVGGITLGLVRQSGFPRRNARNQAWNHAGNAIGAGLSGLLGWRFGMPAVLYLAALFGLLSIAAVLTIPGDAIDDEAARGLEGNANEDDRPSGFRVLVTCRPLLALAASLFAFHLGNAAMLPLYGLAVVSSAHGDPALTVAATIVIAQLVMVAASFVAMRSVDRPGEYFTLLLVSFLALPVRGLVAGMLTAPWAVIPVQVLDGIGAGLQSVAVPGLVVQLLRGSGRVNVGQGAVMTVQGVGAALSPLVGGWIGEMYGYRAAFFVLGALAIVPVVIWLKELAPGKTRNLTCERG